MLRKIVLALTTIAVISGCAALSAPEAWAKPKPQGDLACDKYCPKK
jgi:uncharacterized protein YceK